MHIGRRLGRSSCDQTGERLRHDRRIGGRRHARRCHDLRIDLENIGHVVLLGRNQIFLSLDVAIAGAIRPQPHHGGSGGGHVGLVLGQGLDDHRGIDCHELLRIRGPAAIGLRQSVDDGFGRRQVSPGGVGIDGLSCITVCDHGGLVRQVALGFRDEVLLTLDVIGAGAVLRHRHQIGLSLAQIGRCRDHRRRRQPVVVFLQLDRVGRSSGSGGYVPNCLVGSCRGRRVLCGYRSCGIGGVDLELRRLRLCHCRIGRGIPGIDIGLRGSDAVIEKARDLLHRVGFGRRNKRGRGQHDAARRHHRLVIGIDLGLELADHVQVVCSLGILERRAIPFYEVAGGNEVIRRFLGIRCRLLGLKLVIRRRRSLVGRRAFEV